MGQTRYTKLCGGLLEVGARGWKKAWCLCLPRCRFMCQAKEDARNVPANPCAWV